jgi:hypothetical protein
MSRLILMAATAFALVLTADQGAFAQMVTDVVRLPHPAPAPLLAAGIPAFAFLGGGVVIARLVRSVKRRLDRD